MSHEIAATHIMYWLHEAEAKLVGSTVTTFNDDTGIVSAVRLDENHGLCFSLDRAEPVRWRPVSTIARIS